MIARIAILLATLAAPVLPAGAAPVPSFEFGLANGLHVVVLPDNRSEAVTHLIGYRAGSADEAAGKTGLAHFVEHLMFKSTRTKKAGEFARLIASAGGIENAMTTRDATIYYQRVTKPQLESVMAFEADRMVNLEFVPEEAAAELDVVLAERRARIDGSPFNQLSVEIDAALYPDHPYRAPSIGWADDIATLTVADARRFYERHYRPDNAIVVIAGDIGPDEARRLAQATYGKIGRPETSSTRPMASEPAAHPHRRVELRDRRAAGRSLYRVYRVPAARQSVQRQAEALELLIAILARGEASRLGQSLVVGRGAAHSVDGGYKGLNRLVGEAAMLVSGGDAMPVAEVEHAIADAIGEIARHGVTQPELDRARAMLAAKRSYDWDSQLRKARAYADALLAGVPVQQIEGWQARLDAVSTADIRAAASLLLAEKSVTGLLLPAGNASPAAAACKDGASC